MQNIKYNLNLKRFLPWRCFGMKYGELNNLLSVAMGISVVLTGSFIAYISQKNIFRKKGK